MTLVIDSTSTYQARTTWLDHIDRATVTARCDRDDDLGYPWLSWGRQLGPVDVQRRSRAARERRKPFAPASARVELRRDHRVTTGARRAPIVEMGVDQAVVFQLRALWERRSTRTSVRSPRT